MQLLKLVKQGSPWLFRLAKEAVKRLLLTEIDCMIRNNNKHPNTFSINLSFICACKLKIHD